MNPHHKRAIQLYQQSQRLSQRPEPIPHTYHDCEYEVVETIPARFREIPDVHVTPQIFIIREPGRPEPKPEKDAQNEADLMAQVFMAAFFGSAAFFVLYALITLLAGGRS